MNKDEKKILEEHKKKLKTKFIIYMSFLAFILLLLLITGSFKPKNRFTKGQVIDTPRVKEITYYDMQKELYEGSYSYEFIIDDITYTGISKDGVHTGFKEEDNDIIKYEAQNNKTYKIESGNKIEYNELYDGLDAQLFDFKKLFDKINASSTIKSKEGDLSIYKYDNVDGYNITIKSNDSHIINIEIIKDVNYTFTFTF